MTTERAEGKRQFGHRARLALTPAQIRLMDDQAHAARTMWNCLHDWWTMLPKDKRSLAAADAAIRQARKEIDWLGVLPAQAGQAVLKTYVQAWKNCWEGRAEAPNFKARLRTVMSVDIPQGRDLNIRRVHRRWGMVNIPKVGRVRFRWTKDLPVGKRADSENRITGARLVKDALGWHIAFRVQTRQAKPEPHQGPEVGIDAGVNLPLALSDGNHQSHGRPPRLPGGKADRDKWLNPDEKAKLLDLQRRAARRRQHRGRGEKTSRRLQYTYDQIKQLRAKATRRAVDWQHKTTTGIAQQYGTVVVEALTITSMVKSAKGTIEEPGKNLAQKSGLNRSISQEAWGRTVTMLTYKTARCGGTLHKVPAPGTSLRCSACGFNTPGSREDQATFVCKNEGCGWSGNADWNAARNVLHLYRMGHALISAAGRAVVRRTRGAKPAAAR
ncbi:MULTISPECIES: transposase [unclassified Streptomyces]|uniref:RNA-guided endonuclease InsQ/TnpB family protein n=1 Tax=unclassified Streptomyces TaxID=2593676 RepID=UPI00224CBEAD|nr:MULTISPECIES: transposase [unclassified Streptomyces]MCX4641218.1 transposase [Streptomyces sp. NBC_01446]MCX5322365.1 transposase [Streptomyces sp. NBC_00120]